MDIPVTKIQHRINHAALRTDTPLSISDAQPSPNLCHRRRQLCQYLLSLGHSVVALDILPAESPRQRVKVEGMKGYTYVVGSAEDYEVYGECVKGVMGLYILQQSIRDWKGL